MRQKKNALALETHLGTELHRRSTELTRAWLDRLLERLDVQPRRVFPAEALLNRMPEVLSSVSDYLSSEGDLASERLVRDEFAQLARLRREQGYDIDEILAEFEILGGILYKALREDARTFGRKVEPDYAIEVAERLHRALDLDHHDHRHDLPGRGVPRPPRARPPARRLRPRPGARAAQPAGLGGDRPPPARRLAGARQPGEGDAHPPADRAEPQGGGGRHPGAGDRPGERGDGTGAAALATRAGRRDGRGAAGDGGRAGGAHRDPGADPRRPGRRHPRRAGADQPGGQRRQVLRSRRGGPLGPPRRPAAARTASGASRWPTTASASPRRCTSWSSSSSSAPTPGSADGTGLGLAIVQAAIQQMGGRVWLESTPGDGTTFHFTVIDPPAARE